MVLPAGGPGNKGCLEGRDTLGTAGREAWPGTVALTWQLLGGACPSGPGLPCSGPQRPGWVTRGCMATHGPGRDMAPRNVGHSIWLGTDEAVCVTQEGCGWVGTQPRAPGCTFLGSRAGQRTEGEAAGRHGDGGSRRSAPSVARLLEGSRCDHRETLVGPTLVLTPGWLAAWLDKAGCWGSSTCKHTGVGTLGHGGHQQEIQGQGDTCSEDQPDPCSSHPGG